MTWRYVLFICLISFCFSVPRIPRTAILSDKAKFRNFDTSSESRKFIFNSNTQLLVQLVAILLQMKLDHANEQIVQDVSYGHTSKHGSSENKCHFQLPYLIGSKGVSVSSLKSTAKSIKCFVEQWVMYFLFCPAQFITNTLKYLLID